MTELYLLSILVSLGTVHPRVSSAPSERASLCLQNSIGLINNGARKMKCCSLDGIEDGEHNGSGFVEVSTIFMTQDTFFFATHPFDGVYPYIIPDVVWSYCDVLFAFKQRLKLDLLNHSSWYENVKCILSKKNFGLSFVQYCWYDEETFTHPKWNSRGHLERKSVIWNSQS